MSLTEFVEMPDASLIYSVYIGFGVPIFVITTLLRVFREGFNGKIKHRLADVVLVPLISSAFILSYTLLVLDSLGIALLMGVIFIVACYLFAINMARGYNRKRSIRESEGVLYLCGIATFTGWGTVISGGSILLWPELIFGVFLWSAILFYKRDGLLRLNREEKSELILPEFARNSLLQILIISNGLPFCLGVCRMLRFIHRKLPLHEYL